MESAPSTAWSCRKSVARQRRGKYASTTIEAVFPAGSVHRSSLKNKRRYDSILISEFSAEDRHRNFVDLLRLKVRLEDFIHV
jgi:hypothetical protein